MRPQSILLLKDKLKLNYFMRSRTGLWPGRLFKLNLLQYGHKNDNENNRTVIIFVFYPSIRYTIAKYSGLIRFVEVHMASTLKLPVGIENFEEIIRNNFYYIDKTRLIEQLLQGWGKVTLFTRPRRFGKTLNMSMLKSFFEIGTYDTVKRTTGKFEIRRHILCP